MATDASPEIELLPAETGVMAALAITTATWPEAKALVDKLVQIGLKVRFAAPATDLRSPEVLLEANGCRLIISCAQTEKAESSVVLAKTKRVISYTSEEAWGKQAAGISLAVMTLDCGRMASRGLYEGACALHSRKVFRSSKLASKLVVARPEPSVPDGVAAVGAKGKATHTRTGPASIAVCADAREPSCGLRIRFFQCSVDVEAPLAAQMAALPPFDTSSPLALPAVEAACSAAEDVAVSTPEPSSMERQLSAAREVADECLGPGWRSRQPASPSVLGDHFAILVKSSNPDATAHSLTRLLAWQRPSMLRRKMAPPFYWAVAQPESIAVAVAPGWPRSVPIEAHEVPTLLSGSSVGVMGLRHRAAPRGRAAPPGRVATVGRGRRPRQLPAGPGSERAEADPVVIFIPPHGCLAAATAQLLAAGFVQIGDRVAKTGSAGIRTFSLDVDASQKLYFGLMFRLSPGIFGSPDDTLFERVMRWAAILGLVVALLVGFIYWGQTVKLPA